MQKSGTAIGRMGQLRLFVASLWLTLATALFCAVMPAGLPHSAKHGSAFSPANSVVSLQAPSSGNRAVLRRAAEGEPAIGASGSDLVAPSPAAAVAAPVAVAGLPAVILPIAFAVSKPLEARYPRGPPTA
ncbi:MAG: hypothetical protein EOP62_15660 [Sphingomonadales bacterium]|nr:MAG: hypothetical protein EOP62_15660 [Sphingomonadales bacterium]